MDVILIFSWQEGGYAMPTGIAWAVIVSFFVQYYTGDDQEQRMRSKETFATEEACKEKLSEISERMRASYFKAKERLDGSYVASMFEVIDVEQGCVLLTPVS